MRLGFVGLGKLGLPCAAAFSVQTKTRVAGFDLNPDVGMYISEKNVPYMEKDIEKYLAEAQIDFMGSVEDVVLASDVIFVAVQTPHDPEYEGNVPVPPSRKDFDYSALTGAVAQIAQTLERNPSKSLKVVVISTVLPGTMRSRVLPLFNDVADQLQFFYNPYFIAMGNTIPDFLHPEFTLIGTDVEGEALQEIVDLYAKVHSAPVRTMQIESAELTKVAYNTFIGFKIVFANSLGEIVQKRGGNVDEVTTALALAHERLISGKYLSAGMADGGGATLEIKLPCRG